MLQAFVHPGLFVSVFTSNKKKILIRQRSELPLEANLTGLPTLEAPDNAVILK